MHREVRLVRLALLALLPGALVACHAQRDPIIDSWPVGAAYECQDESGQTQCADMVRVGLAGLDTRDPGHAPVVATQLHREVAFTDDFSGEQKRVNRSGSCSVLVVDLADGSTRAIGVCYVGRGEVPIAVPESPRDAGY